MIEVQIEVHVIEPSLPTHGWCLRDRLDAPIWHRLRFSDSDIETGATVYTVYAAWDGSCPPIPKRYCDRIAPLGTWDGMIPQTDDWWNHSRTERIRPYDTHGRGEHPVSI